jgi:hypothetical protein
MLSKYYLKRSCYRQFYPESSLARWPGNYANFTIPRPVCDICWFRVMVICITTAVIMLRRLFMFIPLELEGSWWNLRVIVANYKNVVRENTAFLKTTQLSCTTATPVQAVAEKNTTREQTVSQGVVRRFWHHCSDCNATELNHPVNASP